jgi:deoxyribodipyrimidine photolyase-related protein
MHAPIVSVWILGDQLLADHPALRAAEAQTSRSAVRVVLVESAARLSKLSYQRKKLVLLLSAMRHYAEELQGQGYQVDYVRAPSALEGLKQHVAAHGVTTLVTMAATEYAGRRFQQESLGAALGIPVTVVPNGQMLVEAHDPVATPGKRAPKRVVMETFYRAMRRHFDVLLDADGEPSGGQWNFDKENRKPLPKRGLAVPAPRTFAPDTVTREVMAQVAAMDGPVGTVDGFALAVTRAQAQQAFEDFIAHRLAEFGPYEDAMSRRHAVLFHSTLSPYMNLGLLAPLAMVRRAEHAYRDGHAPINSVEGFVRQILGWREFIYWQYWQQMPDMLTANAWDHQRPMPRFFWTAATDMACLHHAVDRVIDTGYGHHIERLMLICNFCMLAGIDPAAVNRWFLSFYVDAYEWVVTPNVIGMGLNADGGITATKPYIASANYINKMSDYCAGCRYDHTRRHGDDACPFNFLYWNFLLEHEATLRGNPRFGPAVLGLKHLDDADRTQVARQAAAFLDALEAYAADD